jgi:putative modified peptide
MTSNFSPAFADKLLDKLSTDEPFRAAFDHNPRAALKQLGYETTDADRDVRGADPVPCLYNSKPLPSKEQFRLARQQLHDQLTASVSTFRIFNLT